MKVTAIAQTITMLEQEIEALEQRRGELLRVIDSLRPLAGEGSATRRSKKALKRTDGRTDGRTEQSARQVAGREGASLTTPARRSSRNLRRTAR